MQDKDMLTLKQASKYTGYSVSYIRKKILNGELEGEKRSFKYGRKWVISKENLDRMVKHARSVQDVVEVSEPMNKNELIQAIREVAGTGGNLPTEMKDTLKDLKEEQQEIKEQQKQLNEKYDKLLQEIQRLIIEMSD